MPFVHIKDGVVTKKSFVVPKKESRHNVQIHAMGPDGDYRDTWRVFRIMAEFIEGYQFLGKYHNEVTVYGSARFAEDHQSYKAARTVGAKLGQSGHTVITGGGPGIMEAANRGAYEAKGTSLGLNITLPKEQSINPFVTDSLSFHYFFSRKVMLAAPSQAFVFFPGGFGTLDEFFEVADLMGDGYLHKAPIILFGSKFWQPVIDWLVNNKVHRMAPEELALLESVVITDDPEKLMSVVSGTKDVPNVCKLSPGHYSCEGKEINWRILRIMAEMVEGFDFLTGIVKDVTVLGSGKIDNGSTHGDSARLFGQLAAKNGFSVVTGGYQGIAKAANSGAKEAGGESIGLYMDSALAQGKVNEHLSRSISFLYPFTRKLVLTAPSKGFVMFPGGLGTLHQTMEVLTLIQTGKMPPVPVILFGSEYWSPYVALLRGLADTHKTINKDDVDLFTITDDPQEALDIIKEAYSS